MIVGCYDGEILSKASTLLTFQDRYDAMLALELGKKAKHDLAQPTVSQETGTIAAQKSAYRKSKDRPRERPAPPSTATDRTPAPDTKCYGCGNNIHGRTMREHRDKKPFLCPARDSVCSHCSRRGHLSSRRSPHDCVAVAGTGLPPQLLEPLPPRTSPPPYSRSNPTPPRTHRG